MKNNISILSVGWLKEQLNNINVEEIRDLALLSKNQSIIEMLSTKLDQHIINLVELLKINNIPNSETTNQIFNKLTEIKEALNATTN